MHDGGTPVPPAGPAVVCSDDNHRPGHEIHRL